MFAFDLLTTEDPLPPERRLARYQAKRTLLKLAEAWHAAFPEQALDVDDLFGDWPEIPAALRRQAD